jgi:hypothetical protein
LNSIPKQTDKENILSMLWFGPESLEQSKQENLEQYFKMKT